VKEEELGRREPVLRRLLAALLWWSAVGHVEKTTLGEERSSAARNRLILGEERWWGPRDCLPVLHMRGGLPLEIVLARQMF
jgi:hypothetical protein